MPVWTRIQDSGIDHWADLPAAQAWARNALALASEANERRLSGSGADTAEQAVTLARAIDALGTAYRAANVSPTTEPTWTAAMRAAYGPIGAGATVSSDGAQGFMVTQARDVFRAVTGQAGSAFKTYARLYLAPDGTPQTGAVDDDAVRAVFAASQPWTGRAHPGGGACVDPFADWECVAWSTPPGGAQVLLLPASVWSLGLIRIAAQAIANDPRAWLIAGLRNGAAPIVDTGDVAPPNDPSLDIASAVRPPAPPPAAPTPPTMTPPTTPANSSPAAPATPQPLTAGEAASLVPVLLAGGLLALVLWGQSVRPPKRRR